MVKRGLAAFWLSGFLAACNGGTPTSAPSSDPAQVAPQPSPATDPGKIEAAKAAILKERGVIDLVYDPTAVVQWTIAMKDDGSSRVGRAETFCMQLSELGVADQMTHVRIVDFKRYMASQGDARGASLGHVACATGQSIDP